MSSQSYPYWRVLFYTCFLALTGSLHAQTVPVVIAPGPATLPVVTNSSQERPALIWAQGTQIFFSQGAPTNVWSPPLEIISPDIVNPVTFTQIASAPNGSFFVAAWIQNGQVYASWFFNGAWTAAENLSASVIFQGNAFNVQIAIETGGQVTLAWEQSGNLVFTVSSSSQGVWNTPQDFFTNITAMHLTQGFSDIPVLAYGIANGSYISYLTNTNPITWSPSIRVAPGVAVGSTTVTGVATNGTNTAVTWIIYAPEAAMPIINQLGATTVVNSSQSAAGVLLSNPANGDVIDAVVTIGESGSATAVWIQNNQVFASTGLNESWTDPEVISGSNLSPPSGLQLTTAGPNGGVTASWIQGGALYTAVLSGFGWSAAVQISNPGSGTVTEDSTFAGLSFNGAYTWIQASQVWGAVQTGGPQLTLPAPPNAFNGMAVRTGGGNVVHLLNWVAGPHPDIMSYVISRDGEQIATIQPQPTQQRYRFLAVTHNRKERRGVYTLVAVDSSLRASIPLVLRFNHKNTIFMRKKSILELCCPCNSCGRR